MLKKRETERDRQRERERETHQLRYCCLPITSDNGSISGSRAEIVPRSVDGRQYVHRCGRRMPLSLRGRNFGCRRRHQDGNRKLDDPVHRDCYRCNIMSRTLIRLRSQLRFNRMHLHLNKVKSR